MSSDTGLLQRARAALPSGVRLPQAEWEQRHRWIIRLLWLHVPIIVIYGFATGNGAVHNVGECLPTAFMGFLGTRKWIDRRSRAMLTGLGLMIASAVLVHLSGGVTEMHFHFFVMLGVISLYQDWQPFLVSIAFVALHHGVMGVLRPEDVFDNPVAWRSPLLWAGIHAFFVLCAAAVSITSWGIVEAGHRRSRAQLEASERRFRALIEHSSDVVTVIDADGTITYDSPSSEAVLGYPSRERVGQNGFSFVHDDDRARVTEVVAQVAANGGTANVELRVRHRNGSYRWVEASITNLFDEPEVNGLVANFRDITDRKSLEDQLAHQAFHDPLTGLANRALLLDRIDHALATRRRDPKRKLALLYLDLDDFKTVNDALGHEAGDALLREAAARLTASLRPGDTASRLGGDEFAVVLEGLAERDVAYEIGARLLESLQNPFDANGEGVCINASIGIAVSTGTEDAAALLRNADLAMYRAKGEGKGPVRDLRSRHACRRRRPHGAQGRHAPRVGRATSSSRTTSRSSTSRRDASPASKRWCGGTIRSEASSRRTRSSRWPRRPGSSSRSAAMCSTKRAPMRPNGSPSSATAPRSRCRSTCRLARSKTRASSATSSSHCPNQGSNPAR